jgi:hypothetical protein
MRFAPLLSLCLACSSNPVTTDAGGDAPNDDDATNAACSVLTSDASFTCDVSAVPPADRGCATWASTPPDSNTLECPGSADWNGSAGSGCVYTWGKSGPPDLCSLPWGDDGSSPFRWLHPTCDNGCDASIDVAPPAPCATSSDCPSTQYCEVNGNCGASGTCFPIDNGGVGIGGQVCGCDGNTYSGYDAAHSARVSVAYDGACE